MDVPFQERLLAAGGEDLVHGPAGEGHPQREQRADHQLAGQLDRDVTEVDLGLRAGHVRLRHQHARRTQTLLDRGSPHAAPRRTS
ncbi:hypothetical protein HNR08_002004 [Cellulomonas hominis]|uniref:Uncharacterized protein n=1 Tax=Cellulomonas hominis TaxID=156981 RepID=A0A7W8WB04_9CELL|nr:hypothetical protein [Cellulomonas hominis]MBB5473268.1 hypothetical protein [Cellulomonas hominis]